MCHLAPRVISESEEQQNGNNKNAYSTAQTDWKKERQDLWILLRIILLYIIGL